MMHKQLYRYNVTFFMDLTFCLSRCETFMSLHIGGSCDRRACRMVKIVATHRLETEQQPRLCLCDVQLWW